MPSFFPFQQGSEAHFIARAGRASTASSETSPLLGRFRAVPRTASARARGGKRGGERRGDGRDGRGYGGGYGYGYARRDGYGAVSDASGPTHAQDEERRRRLRRRQRRRARGGSSKSGATAQRDEADGYDDDFDSDSNSDLYDSECDSNDETVSSSSASSSTVLHRLAHVWLRPRRSAVRALMHSWWARGALLWVLPAGLAVAWCALPMPKYEIPGGGRRSLGGGGGGWSGAVGGVGGDGDAPDEHLAKYKTPGHGEARVEINFWFFLLVYYGFYNVTALMWITKVFNIYCLNWWPTILGFPLTVTLIAIISLAVPIPLYYIPSLRPLASHNTLWMCLTFFTMALPLLSAISILLLNERHLALRKSLSETQRLFTSSWWIGEGDDTISAPAPGRRPPIASMAFDPFVADATAATATAAEHHRHGLRKRWIPSSFVRFLWFCAALVVAMTAYLLGEMYAEIYLRTLPHDTIETVFYVYSWVLTIHCLDGLTGWILGGDEGERVGSYPLAWIFKLYFSLTYQTYVRALYARLRSPAQFLTLQILSSTLLIVLAPLTISRPFHRLLTLLNLNGQGLDVYQKFCARNVYVRSLSENVSMLAFLGSILVLHYGSNKDVYPYFAFDAEAIPSISSSGSDTTAISTSAAASTASQHYYDFGLTFYAASVTWACEMVAGWMVRRLLALGWRVDVTRQARRDLVDWPELLPTAVVVMVHVLQNMIFSIARLRFH